MKKVLIIVGGGTRHLAPFEKEAKDLKVDLTTASFSSLAYLAKDGRLEIKVGGVSLKEFEVIYIRLVGEAQEEAALLARYCRENAIRLVDKIFTEGSAVRVPLPKSIETAKLVQEGLPVPKTYFAKLEEILIKGPVIFGFPFVIKGTTGKQGNAVWSPRNKEELEKVREKINAKEKTKVMRFLAQEFVRASQRVRVLVVGKEAVAAITRPTRWRRRFIEKVNGEYPEGKREALSPLPEKVESLAVKAAQTLGIEIAGVDILEEDRTGRLFVLEVNSAPRWASIKEDAGVNVEREILKYLINL